MSLSENGSQGKQEKAHAKGNLAVAPIHRWSGWGLRLFSGENFAQNGKKRRGLTPRALPYSLFSQRTVTRYCPPLVQVKRVRGQSPAVISWMSVGWRVSVSATA